MIPPHKQYSTRFLIVAGASPAKELKRAAGMDASPKVAVMVLLRTLSANGEDSKTLDG
jgi:hypothetical protein